MLGIGLQTKGLMLVLGVVLGLAYLVAGSRGAMGRAVRSGSLAMGVAFVIGGWWWASNLLTYGRVQPLRLERGRV